MDQATLNQYFESGAGLLAHHADDASGAVESEAGHGISEADHHGPLDLLLNAISKPAAHAEAGMHDNRYQVESLGHRQGEMRPEDVLHEEDVFLRYDPEDTAPMSQQQDGVGRRDVMMMDRIASTDGHEGEQTGNSIQGLLAASRMISGDTENGEDIAANQQAGPSEPAVEIVTTPPVGSRRINPNPMKRRATSPPLSDLRRAKITRMFAATIGPSGSRVPEQQMSFSTITIMHGHIAQKSYGKEKRFLCPPPVVRMTGNISDTVETAVFKLVNADVGEDIPVISNTQGVRLDMLERDLDARAHLREGISFPGLYASRTGKAKGLQLRLDVFQPGGTLPREQDVDLVDPMEELFDAEPIENHKAGNAGADDIFSMTELATSEQDPSSANKEEFEKPPRSPVGPSQSAGQETQARPNASHESAGADQVPLEIQDMIRNDTEVDEPSDAAKQVEDRDKRIEYTPEAEEDANEAVTLLNQEDGGLAIATGLVEDFNRFQISDRPWATFEASGIQIVSKPSKQTVGVSKPSKNSRAVGIRIGDPFALWSRVSAQTVMTRYLYVDIDRGLLVGRNADWSAWVMDVVRRGDPPEGQSHDLKQHPDILTYGSIVILRDIHTQYRSEPLLLCKVVNGAVYLHDHGPVSELHRVAFAKTVPDQGRWYLRSPMIERVRDKRGPRAPAKPRPKQKKSENDTAGAEERNEELASGLGPHADVQTASGSYTFGPEPTSERKTEAPSGSSHIDAEQPEEKPGLSPALYSAPQIKLEEGESGLVETEFLDDYLTWTISGITEHSFTFFEGRHEIGDYSTVFKFPLTPMPEILEVPVYNDRDNTITMAVTNYFYDDDNVMYRDKPLYLYLGAIGPLRVRTYQSIAPEDNWEVVDKEPHRFPAIASDGGPDGSPETRPYSAVPRNVEHTVLVISCPDPLDMWNATQIERERYERKAQIELLSHSALAAEDGVDDSVHLPVLPPYAKADQDRKKVKKTDTSTQLHVQVPEGSTSTLPDQPSGDVESSAVTVDRPDGPQQPASTNGMQVDSAIQTEETAATADVESNDQVEASTSEDQHHAMTHTLSGQTGEETEHDLPINHFTQAEFAQHDLQQPNFGQDGTEGQPDHHENEITREMVENLVRQAQLQEHDGDLSAYTGLNPFSAEGFNMDDQHQIALLAAQAARSQVDSILHSDMTYVQGVATDIGIFTARALEAAAQAAQSGSDMLDPQAILAQHQATLANATQLEDGTEAHIGESAGRATDADLDLANLAGMDMTPENTEVMDGDGQASTSKGAKGKKGKKPSKEKKVKVPKVKAPRGGPKRPRTVPPAPTLVPSPLAQTEPPLVKITKRPFDGVLTAQGHVPRSKQLGGSSLPLLFLRQSDNTGYHTSKNLIVDRAESASGYTWDIRIQ